MTLKVLALLLLPVINLITQISIKHISKRDLNGLVGVEFLKKMVFLPEIWLIAGFQFFSFMLWSYVLSKTELGIANAIVGSSFYILASLTGILFFQEYLSVKQWMGIFFVTAGSLLLITGK